MEWVETTARWIEGAGVVVIVAGDIIATILVEHDLPSVGALAIVVLIRTFLSFSLETEIEGRFPWQRAG
jgi:uncharacterized membrane protein